VEEPPVTVHEAGIGRSFEGCVIGDVHQRPLGRTSRAAGNTPVTTDAGANP